MIRFTGNVVYPPQCPTGSFFAPSQMRRKLLSKGYLEYPKGCYSRIISVSPIPPAAPWAQNRVNSYYQ